VKALRGTRFGVAKYIDHVVTPVQILGRGGSGAAGPADAPRRHLLPQSTSTSCSRARFAGRDLFLPPPRPSPSSEDLDDSAIPNGFDDSSDLFLPPPRPSPSSEDLDDSGEVTVCAGGPDDSVADDSALAKSTQVLGRGRWVGRWPTELEPELEPEPEPDREPDSESESNTLDKSLSDSSSWSSDFYGD
jgi:hypothetical protein